MRKDRMRRRIGVAKIGLGISIVLSVVGFVYFTMRGQPVAGAGLGVVLVIGGVWEYHRRIQDLRRSEQYEAEARSDQYTHRK